MIILGRDSLTLNEYGDKRDEVRVEALMKKAVVTDINSVGTDLDKASVEAVSDTVSKVIGEEGLTEITFIDKTTGKALEDVEYFYTEYDGKYIVNICTYRNDDVDVQMFVNGKAVENSTDLISLEDLQADIKLKAYKPRMIAISK